ncbi:DUF871 domain-containing protein [Fundicoccus culcitae]|uniref:MupG family TIM beta-alpha barrel fold protein n=1 Tax=Fundicoccus culcitae TaxID=2969821 RepID=A0ABY5P9H6_9LACT|nr:MupG family TIM beta-alpha barrel fold protein [Fundicoccus culcitae]UUX35008.1 MupG family TIM beta-alpha barrel fold protein [Fundicoccus culcitae]
MFGFSMYLNEDLSSEQQAYMEKLQQIGFAEIFTSIHIPEDATGPMERRLKALGQFAQAKGMNLTVDLSADALARLRLSFDDLEPLLAWGVTGLRMDYGVSNATIAQVSHTMQVALNASTLSAQDIAELQQYQANFAAIEAWHNYYPRPETGLDERYFIEKNQWLKEQGLKVMAFVPGDEALRGPIFEGLPTLESHRHVSPFVAAIDLENNYQMDKIFIADPGLNKTTCQQFQAYINEQVLLLHARPMTEDAQRIARRHTNRPDAARDVIRSMEARGQSHGSIPPLNTVERPRGAITIDNDNYLRYKGEVQITKVNIAADPRVNVVGQVIDADLGLLDNCRSNQVFEIIWEEV